MDMKSNGSGGTCRKSVKGFTLIELIVVIAIIAVLAGTLNLAAQGFIRNSRRETANDNARILFTGFQNILTQCEIKQDNSAISPSWVNYPDLKSITISFKVYDGNVQKVLIDGVSQTGSASSTSSAYGVYTGSMLKYEDNPLTPGVSNLPNAIGGIIDSTFEGEAKVYIDYVNFEVKSVVFKPMTDSNKDTTINNFNDGNLVKYTVGGVDYYTYYDGTAQDTAYKNHPLYGVYPFQANVA